MGMLNLMTLELIGKHSCVPSDKNILSCVCLCILL